MKDHAGAVLTWLSIGALLIAQLKGCMDDAGDRKLMAAHVVDLRGRVAVLEGKRDEAVAVSERVSLMKVSIDELKVEIRDGFRELRDQPKQRR